MITASTIERVWAKARTIRAMVIGDAMLDRYIYGRVDRISPEAPVPVLSHQYAETKAGGAANVALNLAAWGCKTSLIGLTGNDPNAQILGDLLLSQGINHHFFKSNGRPTTIKTRVVASSHHLLRIDEESVAYLTEQEEADALEYVLKTLRAEKPDLIVLEDYNKGFLTEKIITSVIGLARQLGVFIAVDPKDKNFFCYHDVDLFKPNLREAGQAVRRRLTVGELKSVCEGWQKEMDIRTIAITLGSQGIYLHHDGQHVHCMPDRSIDVVDVCGAGDAVICSLALGIMSGLPMQEIGALANVTGTYVCSHSGVVAVDVNVLNQWV